MNKNNFQFDYIDTSLSNKGFSQRTHETYKRWIIRLSEYYGKEPEHISIDEINEFSKHLYTRLKLSEKTVNQALAAFRVVFNEIYHKNYDFSHLLLHQPERLLPDILTIAEVKDIIIFNHHTKYRLLFALMYSTGIDIGEVLSIRIEDVDIYQRKLYIQTSRQKGNKRPTKRTLFLTERIAKELNQYVINHKNDIWLFEGNIPCKKLHHSSVNKQFKKSIDFLKIRKKCTPTSLKYAYVVHQVKSGYPLENVLSNMGILSSQSMHFYGRILSRNITINTSPYDTIEACSSSIDVDIGKLELMMGNIFNDIEKKYLYESIICFRVKAFRAGVVFVWGAAIYKIQQLCLNFGIDLVNETIKRHSPKAPKIKRLSDFVAIKDKIILQVGCDLGIYEKSEKDILVQCLTLRNKCSHPTKYNPGFHTVTSFIENVINIAFHRY